MTSNVRIVELTGGLGNQMFQYAFGRGLMKLYPGDRVKYDISYFDARTAIRKYELGDAFGISIDDASKKDIRLIRGYNQLDNPVFRAFYALVNKGKSYGVEVKENLDSDYSESAIMSSLPAYYSGYWQCDKYFSAIRDEIMTTFSFDHERLSDEGKKLLEQIDGCNSVALHIRLDDYLEANNFKVYGGICTKAYYDNAIEYIKKRIPNCKFFVFSTNLDDAIKMLPEGQEFIPVQYSGQRGYIDMQLMTFCKHNIIANSTFSWWGAWLGSNCDKIVVCPERWFNNHDTYNQYCEGWIKMPSDHVYDSIEGNLL